MSATTSNRVGSFVIDLTKIDTPFCELDRLTQWALLGAVLDGEKLECEFADGWRDAAGISVYEHDYLPFRLKSEPVRSIKSARMPAAFIGEYNPVFSGEIIGDARFAIGTASLEMTDGKVTRFVWAPDE